MSQLSRAYLHLTTTPVRYASHADQGAANSGSKDGAGKRLGAKKVGGELVVPGVIIYRQRGTKWFPGENCDMGRDHTIFAMQKGYVRYYRDPLRHPKRRYIGVVFERHQTLPTPTNAPRRRRLGFMSVARRRPEDELMLSPGLFTPVIPEVVGRNKDGRLLTMRRDYSFREPSWTFGRTAEKSRTKVPSKERKASRNIEPKNDSKRGRSKQKDEQKGRGKK